MDKMDEQLRRPRRNRQNEAMRSLVRESHLIIDDLIAPLFVIEGSNQKVGISSMPGQYRYSIDLLVKKIKQLDGLGIRCISLFPGLDHKLKDSKGSESLNADGLLQRAIREVKNACPQMLIMSDVALDPYSSDGHDGVVDQKTGHVLNDETVEILAKMAINQARAGSDIVGPSDMMDGRVGFIRRALDQEGFQNVSIMSYTAKYCSAFYGPFRDALESAPKKGDKKTYQMDPCNGKEALRELRLDESEGADIIMVKPGLAYLDIVKLMSEEGDLPVAVYNVSGEYAMVKAAAEKGWLDGEKAMLEVLISFKRAGAKMILTYFAEEAARLIRD